MRVGSLAISWAARFISSRSSPARENAAASFDESPLAERSAGLSSVSVARASVRLAAAEVF
jgi:hypothetical protein